MGLSDQFNSVYMGRKCTDQCVEMCVGTQCQRNNCTRSITEVGAPQRVEGEGYELLLVKVHQFKGGKVEDTKGMVRITGEGL